MYNVKLKKEEHDGPAYLRVPGLVDRSPNVLKGDLVCLRISGEWFDMEVRETYQDKIYFERDHQMEDKVFRKNTVRSGTKNFICFPSWRL